MMTGGVCSLSAIYEKLLITAPRARPQSTNHQQILWSVKHYPWIHSDKPAFIVHFTVHNLKK